LGGAGLSSRRSLGLGIIRGAGFTTAVGFGDGARTSATVVEGVGTFVTVVEGEGWAVGKAGDISSRLSIAASSDK